MSDYYILKDGKPIPAEMMEWAKFMEGGDDSRRVAMTMVGNIRVSTVFLGLDHSFGGSVPILFETMIFGGEHDEYQERYASLEEAMVGHERAVGMAQANTA